MRLFLIMMSLLLSQIAVSGEQTKPFKYLSEEDENFRSFFDQFNQDADFQLERIIFPLQVVHSSEKVKKTISKKEWTYTDLFKLVQEEQKYRLTVKRLGRKKYHVLCQYKDSGNFISHYFVRKDGKWMLYRIVDDSD